MNGQMTSRQRVMAALNHEEPDRVPMDFGSNYNTSVNVIAYNRLKRHLGITSPTYMRYTIPMLAAVDLDDGREVMKMMGGDILPIPRYYIDGVLTKDWDVFCPDHDIQENVPPERIVATYQAAQEFGGR